MMSGVNYVIYGAPLPEQLQKYHCTIPELLNTGEKYCCSYYSKQGDRWQFGKAN